MGMALVVTLSSPSLGDDVSRAAVAGILLAQAIVGFAVYVCLLVLLRVVRPDERAFIREAIARLAARVRR
jgi:hypothetical protein